jgi:hypothetical protein
MYGGRQRVRTLLAAATLAGAAVVAPSTASAYGEHFEQLVDVQSAHTLPRAAYSLGMRVVPDGGVLLGLRVGITPYLHIGLSYGAGNVVGSGEPDWNDRVELEVKLRLAEDGQFGPVPSIAVGYDSRGYGRQLPDGSYEKPSQGLFIAASKTLPFSEFWEAHAGVSRTLEFPQVRPDFFLGLTARLSEEFSVILEYQLAAEAAPEDRESKAGYLNAGLRWVFVGQFELDLYFRNLAAPSDSAEQSSRSIGFAFYDSF